MDFEEFKLLVETLEAKQYEEENAETDGQTDPEEL